MTAREQVALAEVRIQVWREQRGRCNECGKAMENMQLAHRIPQTKWAIRKYGKAVIHHRANLRGVCGNTCNDAVSISNHPVECDELAMRIQLDLGRNTTSRLEEP